MSAIEKTKRPLWPWAFALLFIIILIANHFLPTQKVEFPLVADSVNDNATVLSQPKLLSNKLNLIDQNTQPFTIEQLKGKWSILFFGFTSCPDVCPVEMTTLQRISQQLKVASAPIPQIILVSVDPENDTPSTLKNYLKTFSDNFVGLTGETKEIKRFAKELGIYHHKTSPEKINVDHSKHGNPSTKIQISHTASYLLINPNAEYHAVFSAPHNATQVAKTFQNITAN
jgi:protein SCO1/2